MKKLYLALCAVCVAALMAGCSIKSQGKMLGWSEIHKGPDNYVYFVGADGERYRCSKKYFDMSPGLGNPIKVTDEEWKASYQIGK